MTIEALQAICEKLPGVGPGIKWENHLCLNVVLNSKPYCRVK